MLITDGFNSIYKSVFTTLNFPHRPIRLFSYLVGSDSGGANDLYALSCENKGKYSLYNFNNLAMCCILFYKDSTSLSDVVGFRLFFQYIFLSFTAFLLIILDYYWLYSKSMNAWRNSIVN